jgi:hypothetical protein
MWFEKVISILSGDLLYFLPLYQIGKVKKSPENESKSIHFARIVSGTCYNWDSSSTSVT